MSSPSPYRIEALYDDGAMYVRNPTGERFALGGGPRGELRDFEDPHERSLTPAQDNVFDPESFGGTRLLLDLGNFLKALEQRMKIQQVFFPEGSYPESLVRLISFYALTLENIRSLDPGEDSRMSPNFRGLLEQEIKRLKNVLSGIVGAIRRELKTLGFPLSRSFGSGQVERLS